MTPQPVTPSHGDIFWWLVALAGAYFGFWLATRAAIAERDAELDPSPSHDDLARRQAEIDAPSKTRLL